MAFTKDGKWSCKNDTTCITCVIFYDSVLFSGMMSKIANRFFSTMIQIIYQLIHPMSIIPKVWWFGFQWSDALANDHPWSSHLLSPSAYKKQLVESHKSFQRPRKKEKGTSRGYALSGVRGYTLNFYGFFWFSTWEIPKVLWLSRLGFKSSHDLDGIPAMGKPPYGEFLK